MKPFSASPLAGQFVRFAGLFFVAWSLTLPAAQSQSPTLSSLSVSVTGELKKWHPITLTLDGPSTDETAKPNPFLDYRFEVVFSQAELSIRVPGYYAADGDAANTSATAGNKWRAHFVPPRTGSWTYRTVFREGDDIAVDLDEEAGTANAYDDIFGSFTIEETDKTGRDFRGKGVLRYVGEHYLQFDNGEFYIKGGADSPENLLAYEDFDQTYNYNGTNFIKSYSAHVADWQNGDPTWAGDKGKGLIGALNYLASENLNSVYFITMNILGDGEDVWPWTDPYQRFRFDVSKLDQWNIVFDHMDQQGLMLHVVTQETENETLLDNGNLGRERKLYFRELIARFSHHLAITWNLGEENDENTTQQRKEFADYIKALDPYDHPVVLHSFPGQYDDVYGPLLGHPTFDGPSIQVGKPEKTHEKTLDWVTQSAQNGRKWYVALDESGPWQDGVTPDGPGNNHDVMRKDVLWGNLMAGGGGVEWFFGFEHPNNDLNAEDFRSRDDFWPYTPIATSFFHDYLPFTEMVSNDGLVSSASAYVFAKEGDTYAIYLPDGGTTDLTISGASQNYTVAWYNPRTGGALQTGTQAEVTGPATVSIGDPPSETSQDWVALIRAESEEPEILYGDASQDGSLSALDASLMLQHGIELITLSSEAQAVSDVSGNGTIIAYDGSLVLQKLVGNITCFPIEEGCAGKGSTGTMHSTAPSFSWTRPQIDPITGASSIVLELEERTPLASLLIDLELPANIQPTSIQHTFPAGWLNIESESENRFLIAAAGVETSFDGPLLTLMLPGHAEGAIKASIIVNEHPVLRLAPFEFGAVRPSQIALEQNYPNPFNPETLIRFDLPEAQRAKLEVFDLTGRLRAQLLDGYLEAGRHEVAFNAAHLPSGWYLYVLDAGGHRLTRRMMLVK